MSVARFVDDSHVPHRRQDTETELHLPPPSATVTDTGCAERTVSAVFGFLSTLGKAGTEGDVAARARTACLMLL